MPTKMKVEKRPKRVIPPGQVGYLLSGRVATGDAETFLFTRDRGAVRRAWKAAGAELLRDWIEERPGTRPWAFWKFSLSEPRRLRVGGRGDLVPAYNTGANIDFGIFGRRSFVDDGLLIAWRRIGCLGRSKYTPFDENDPPTYESSASFLKRYDLLLPGEEKRLPADAFDPEKVQ